LMAAPHPGFGFGGEEEFFPQPLTPQGIVNP
jgi:hypothetical protein